MFSPKTEDCRSSEEETTWFD